MWITPEQTIPKSLVVKFLPQERGISGNTRLVPKGFYILIPTPFRDLFSAPSLVSVLLKKHPLGWTDTVLQKGHKVREFLLKWMECRNFAQNFSHWHFAYILPRLNLPYSPISVTEFIATRQEERVFQFHGHSSRNKRVEKGCCQFEFSL